MATANDKDGASKKLITYTRKKKFPSSVQSVLSNNDLLTAILLRLPVLSLVLFKSVSKHWLSIIKDTNFILRRSQFPNLDSPCGMFLNFYISHRSEPDIYEFLPSDIRVPVCRSSLLQKTFTFGPQGQVARSNVEILHSCNGLLLCRWGLQKLYVYNPSISNMFKMIPVPDNVTLDYHSIGLGMAFDPAKSPHYKIIYGQMVCGRPFGVWVQIHTYSSATGKWSLCEDPFPLASLVGFQGGGVYLNDAIYWLNEDPSKFSRLDIMNEHPVLTTLRTPLTLDGKVHYECRLFESRGCLLLVGKDDDHSRHFTIYEKGNVYSEWSLKYIVNLDDIIKPFPKWWNLCTNVFCIVLGEREEDSFIVLKLDRKVVHHKIMSKTLCTIYNLGSHDNLMRCFQFIPSFANV